MAELFQIKICGITHPDDARAAAAAGADAIGLNFCRTSARGITDEQAARIVDACPRNLQKVGVFVNEPVDDLRRRAIELRLDWIQLHGDEPPELLASLADLAVIRAFRCRDDSLDEVVEYLARCRPRQGTPRAVLLDAWSSGQYGGTGKRLDPDRLLAQLPRLEKVRWILAGGLSAETVGRAVRQLRPHAVDVASGVESTVGRKDPHAMRRFVRAARSASAE
jgi:phosphoribosylanthranilate isomerase